MTKQQENAVKRIRREVAGRDFYDINSWSLPFDTAKQEEMIAASDYEFKQFEVKETDYGVVWVSTEVGLKGDEGTMASWLARTHRHIGIGKRGGLFAYGKKPKGKETKMTAECDVWMYCYRT